MKINQLEILERILTGIARSNGIESFTIKIVLEGEKDGQKYNHELAFDILKKQVLGEQIK